MTNDQRDQIRAVASKARRVAGQTIAGIGPNTPATHAAALMAIAETWVSFAQMLDEAVDE
jgi:hypothetical protein